MGLGKARRASLAQADESLWKAREGADDALRLLRAGVDPVDERKRQREAAQAAEAQKKAKREAERWTLARCARDYHERVIEPSRSSKHAAQWISSLENHVPPALWHKPIADITAPELLDALLGVTKHERARRVSGNRIPETTRRIRQRLDAVFEDAVLRGRATMNPAAAIRRAMREAQPARAAKGKFAALRYREAPALMARLRGMDGTAARALELAVLAAARTSEVLFAEWGEFDLDAGLWTVPAGRMKAKEAHVVYLSPPAVELLRAQAGSHTRWVFPSTMKDDAPLSNMAMLAVLGRLGVRDRTTVHGLCRATFSTWANETGAARPDVIEACLAHRESDKVKAAYNRAEFTDDRRALLAKWAAYLDGAQVIEFPTKRAAP
jgi:integrase